MQSSKIIVSSSFIINNGFIVLNLQFENDISSLLRVFLDYPYAKIRDKLLLFPEREDKEEKLEIESIKDFFLFSVNLTFNSTNLKCLIFFNYSTETI